MVEIAEFHSGDMMTIKKRNIGIPSGSRERSRDAINKRPLILNGSVNTAFVSSVAELEKLDPRFKIMRVGEAQARYERGEEDLDLGC